MQDSETLEIVNLESLLSDELHCESPHHPSAKGFNDAGCTIRVTHRITGCVLGALICESRAVYKIHEMNRGTICADCRRLASECWRIIPI
jgi:hypothetical protein